jgi:hypothetical protein
MKTLFAACLHAAALAAILAVPAARAADPPPAAPAPLVVHEWGTFTSFSGSDGTLVAFEPDNSDLPPFVYCQQEPGSKRVRLNNGCTVSMETPVVYLYSDKPVSVSVKVGFPKGWITEWYPAAAVPPALTADPNGNQHIRWDVKLRPSGPATFIRSGPDNAYYRARETDAVPVEATVPADADPRLTAVKGGPVQREKFLFYRGGGTFPTPVAVKALDGGRVRVTNTTATTLTGLVLVSVRGGKVGFRPLDELTAGADQTASLPEPVGDSKELAGLMSRVLSAAGLYGKEAAAMVRTWERAWFGEDGDRVLYLVPRGRTDELLPLTVTPKPGEVVRVLVGRHDFLTPEREAAVDRIVGRMRGTKAEREAAERELRAVIGRFSGPARELAVKRLGPTASGR